MKKLIKKKINDFIMKTENGLTKKDIVDNEGFHNAGGKYFEILIKLKNIFFYVFIGSFIVFFIAYFLRIFSFLKLFSFSLFLSSLCCYIALFFDSESLEKENYEKNN